MIKVGDKVRRDCSGCRYYHLNDGNCEYTHPTCLDTPETFKVNSLIHGTGGKWAIWKEGDPAYCCPCSQLTAAAEPIIVGNELRFE